LRAGTFVFASFKELLGLKAAEVSAVSVFVVLKTGPEAEVSAVSVFAGLTAGLKAEVSAVSVFVGLTAGLDAEVSAFSVFAGLTAGLDAEVSAFSVFAGLIAGLDTAVSVTNVAVCAKPSVLGGLGGTSVLLLGSWAGLFKQLPILIYFLLEFVFVFFLTLCCLPLLLLGLNGCVVV